MTVHDDASRDAVYAALHALVYLVRHSESAKTGIRLD